MIIERAIATIGKRRWPDTVHIVRIDHTYGRYGSREHVVALCGRRGSGELAYDAAPRCKTCLMLVIADGR